MCYREEAIECVKDHVLQIHKQIYAKYEGDFDRIYTEGYKSKSYTAFYISCRNLNQAAISRFGLRIRFSGEATAVLSE